MPRCRHDHVRGVHKQAWSLSRLGHEVVLVVKESDVDEYLGMQVLVARAPFVSVLRPLLNLPVLYRQVIDLRGDIYVLRNPDTIPLAIALRAFGHKVIYDTHEDFSKRPLIHNGLPSWAGPFTAWLITRLERFLARVTSGVIVTQTQQLTGLGGRTMLQPNAPLTSGPIVKTALETLVEPRNNELSFIYVGEITRARGIFSMLEMIQTVNRRCAARLDLVGWIRSDELREQVTYHPGWRFVRFHGAMSHSDTLLQIKKSTIGLALLKPIGDYPTTSITKLFEYMQFGIPFVASNFEAWVVLTALGSPGLYVNPDSADDIAAAAISLATDAELRAKMAAAGRHYIAAGFNWETVADPFLAMVAGQLQRPIESAAG
jgi:glycosyltransferase involved in cell wall biosynthesis